MTKTVPFRFPPNSLVPENNHQMSAPPATDSSSVRNSIIQPDNYVDPFLDFISSNPTVFHAVKHFSDQLTEKGFVKLSERDIWSEKLERGGKYYFERNGSGLIAFMIGDQYEAGNGAAIVASHIDALTAKVKPLSTKPTREGFLQLGIAQYAGGLNQTWIDRDLGIGGRVFVKDGNTGKIETRLVKLDWPIARIPSIAPHFGIPAEGQPNRETRMVPIIGIDNSDILDKENKLEQVVDAQLLAGSTGSFAATQPHALFKAIAGEIGVSDCKDALYILLH